jgi:hypothetical protein
VDWRKGVPRIKTIQKPVQQHADHPSDFISGSLAHWHVEMHDGSTASLGSLDSLLRKLDVRARAAEYTLQPDALFGGVPPNSNTSSK